MDNAPIISLPPTLLTQEIVYMWHILLKDLGSRGELHLEEANSLKENFRHLDSWNSLIILTTGEFSVLVSSQTQKTNLHLHYQTCPLMSTHKQMVKISYYWVLTMCKSTFRLSDIYWFHTLCLVQSGHEQGSFPSALCLVYPHMIWFSPHSSYMGWVWLRFPFVLRTLRMLGHLPRISLKNKWVWL